MASGLRVIESQITEYENQSRSVVIGVNHLALDTERKKQHDLLQKVKQLEQELKELNVSKGNLPKRAVDLRKDVDNNADALRYLETISQLERSFTALSESVSETSVQLSSSNALSSNVRSKKDLTTNVESCWNYVSQLSRLSQVHIRNAAEYQMFHHSVNEVDAHLQRRLHMTDVNQLRPLPYELNSATTLANEIREHLNHFIHLYSKSGNLMEESKRVNPVYLRLGGIKDGQNVNFDGAEQVRARTLIPIAGPNYELLEGEEVRIMDNSHEPHFWTVSTHKGIVQVPSVCLWISDRDEDAESRAVVLRDECCKTWKLVYERLRERVRVYYTHLLTQMAEKKSGKPTSRTLMNKFLNDLSEMYLQPAAADEELRNAVNKFKHRLDSESYSSDESPLREQDIISLHTPLLRLRDHESQISLLSCPPHYIGKRYSDYTLEFDADRKRVDDELASIKFVHFRF